MRVERLPEYVTTVTVTAAGIAFALYCGTLTGSGQTQIVMMIFGMIAAMIILLTLRSTVWVLIPIAWSLTGVVPSLPLPFALRDVVVLFITVAFLLLIALKIVRFKPRYTYLDLMVVINLAYLATVFVRNPVGTSFFETERVGGRPYLNVAVGFCAYLVLSRAQIGPGMARILPWLITLGNMTEGILGIIASKVPNVVPFFLRFYVSEAFAEFNGPITSITTSEAVGSGRRPTLMYLGGPMANALYSRFPAPSLLNPLRVIRCVAFVTAFILVLLSGFRSVVLTVAAGFLISTYARSGFREVARLLYIAIPAVVLIIAFQGVLYELPLAAQRALSFLPGRWDPIAVAEARGSTEWRVEMWKTVLKSDRYIENKALGDGFGFSQVEMQIRNLGSYATPEEMQERYMVTGGFHSGPISAIRYVGVVGLILFLALLCIIAREAWKLMARCRGTPYEFLAFFVGIPLVFEPFNYVVIFGAFDSGLPQVLFAIGMLKMVQNSTTSEDTPSPVREPLAAPRRSKERLRSYA